MEKNIMFKNIVLLSEDYKEKIRQWRNQEFVRIKMFNKNIISKEEHINFIKMLNEKNDRKYFVAFYDDKPFGVLDYRIYDDNSLEFGYYLIDQQYINGGLGVILEYVILNNAFDNLNVNKVFCQTLYSNKKVISLHFKFGFTTEKKEIQVGEELVDIAYQSIDKMTWKNTKNKIKKLVNYIMPLEKIEDLK